MNESPYLRAIARTYPASTIAASGREVPRIPPPETWLRSLLPARAAADDPTLLVFIPWKFHGAVEVFDVPGLTVDTKAICRAIAYEAANDV